MTMSKGRIILFPCPIVDGKIESLSPESIQALHATTYFVVERAKTARHFIKAAEHPQPISTLHIHELTENAVENEAFLQIVMTGIDVGVISEAGCPGIADPGADIVDWAHRNKILVIPHVGPSSIFMALMSSGMSGQLFTFNGYLPNKKPELITALRKLENMTAGRKHAQIWMETPYRNQFMLETCIQSLNDKTRLCVACDINAPTQHITTLSISEWRKMDLSVYHKRPTIYVMG
jgi:16S rRNA (cytidine1402-2'-O)-methyltransferase